MAYRPEPDVIAGVATVVGDELHVPRGAMLPEVCLKCGIAARHVPKSDKRKKDPNAPKSIKLRTGPRTMTWVPAVLVFGWFLMPLFALVAMAILRKQSDIVYSLCRPCEERRLDALAASRFIILGAIVIFLVTLTLIFNDHQIAGVALAFGGGAAGLLAWRRLVIGRTLDVMWIHSDGTVALKGVHADAIRACSEPRLVARRG